MMTETSLQELYAEAVRDVEAGVKHACRTTPECRLLSGCPKCGIAVMRGLSVGVERITVDRRSGVVRLMIPAGHSEQPCVVSFAGVEVTIHG